MLILKEYCLMNYIELDNYRGGKCRLSQNQYDSYKKLVELINNPVFLKENNEN